MPSKKTLKRFKVEWDETWTLSTYAEVEAYSEEEAKEKWENDNWDKSTYSQEPFSQEDSSDCYIEEIEKNED